MKNKYYQKGSLLIELLVTMALAALILPTVLTGIMASRDGKVQARQRMQGVMLLKETEEAVKLIQKSDWINLPNNGNYYPVISGTTWSLVPGASVSGGFTYQITISDVNRDAAGKIVTAPSGSVDPSTKKAFITVSWTNPIPSTISSTLYLTHNINKIRNDTTIADFNNGTGISLAIERTGGSPLPDDGQIQLGQGFGGASSDWCRPATPTANLVYDIPGQGYATSVTTYFGHAFTTSGNNASGNPLDGINITNPAEVDQIALTNGGAYTQFNGEKTYGLTNDGVYTYLSSNRKTVDIVNPATMLSVGYYDNGLVGSTVAVATIDNHKYGFVTAGNTLYSFDLDTISGTQSQTQIGSVSLAGTGSRVMVATGSASYAYVATGSTTSQLQIINVSNPASMSVTSSFNAGNSQAGVDVFVPITQDVAYLVTSYSATNPEFFIIDLSNKSAPQTMGGPGKGTYQTVNGMNPKAVIVVPGNRAIIGGAGGEEYQVINIINKTDPVRCGGVTWPAASGVTKVQALSGIMEPDGDSFAYIVTDNASGEFQVIAGGAYATSGFYESEVLDPGHVSTYNRFVANVAQPANTTIKMQVAVATSSGSFTYVGPDGSPNTYFTPANDTIIGLIPLTHYNPFYNNPERYFKYKVLFDSFDKLSSPILYDIDTNYSP